jgi:hypothetical protein
MAAMRVEEDRKRAGELPNGEGSPIASAGTWPKRPTIAFGRKADISESLSLLP